MASADHNALIAAAAKAALRPLGCVQKGKSRTWLDDHGWWIGVIEFQPSAWAKGTYLNVGACWLWSDKGFLSFDDGYRVEPFHKFEEDEQFEGAAQLVAQHARDEVAKLRQRFCTIESAATYLGEKASRESDIWAHFHAGVSAGLMGWVSDARCRLEKAIAADNRDLDWVRNLKDRCTRLLALTENTPEFRSCVAKFVAHERSTLKLPPLTEVSFEL